MSLVGYYISKELGRPVNYQPEEFELVYFEVQEAGAVIVIWTNDDEGSRLYRFPYNREVAKKMQEAMKKKNQQKGAKIKGRLVREATGQEPTFEYETDFQTTSENYTK